MAEEKYAPEATAKDKRVQEVAYNDAGITVKTLTENRAAQPENALKEGTKTKAIDSDNKLEEPSKDELEDIKNDARTIVDNAALTDNRRAAAEILEKIAERQLDIKKKIDKKEKVRYSRSANMFSSIYLYRKPAVGSKAEAKIELYSELRDKHNTYLANRFAGSALSFADRLLKASETPEKELSAPVEKSKKYSEL